MSGNDENRHSGVRYPFERVRAIALALPGAAEKLVVGHPAFYTRKVFAYLGMSYKVDGVIIRQPCTFSVLLPPQERLALLHEGRAHVPMYIGPWGWIGIHLDRKDVDFDEVAELVEESYRATASARLIRQLEARD